MDHFAGHLKPFQRCFTAERESWWREPESSEEIELLCADNIALAVSCPDHACLTTAAYRPASDLTRWIFLGGMPWVRISSSHRIFRCPGVMAKEANSKSRQLSAYCESYNCADVKIGDSAVYVGSLDAGAARRKFRA